MDFAKCLSFTVVDLIKSGAEVSIQDVRASCFIDMMRNTLIAQFMKSDCTHILFIDDDMGWEPERVKEMLLEDKEFIAAVGPKKVDAGDQFACEILTNPDKTPYVVDGLIQASRVGAAFMLLKRSVIEKLEAKYPEMKCSAVSLEHGYRFFQTIYTENMFKAEDYFFCDLWTAINGKIWIYPNMDFIHTGVKDYRGNYHKFLLGGEQPDREDPNDLIHSIVIVAYKAKEDLEKCLNSLVLHPPENKSEIILVDNSPEPIQLNGVLYSKLKEKYSLTVINEIGNLGFAEGCNVGARLSKGKYLTFINPDTVVYHGWAEGIKGHFVGNVGAVGPLSNFVASLQNIVYYEKLEESQDWEALASRYYSAGRRAGLDTRLLIGFFLMVPKAVWDKVGEFDKAFFLGCDDLDYSLRLRDAGYSLRIATDVFVFHKGHASFEAESESLKMNIQSEAEMRKKLIEKYGNSIPSSTELWGCNIFPTDFKNVIPA